MLEGDGGVAGGVGGEAETGVKWNLESCRLIDVSSDINF